MTSARCTRASRLHHPIVGELQLTVESMQIHSGGQLTLWAAIAEAGSPSEASLARLDEWAGAHSVAATLSP